MYHCKKVYFSESIILLWHAFLHVYWDMCIFPNKCLKCLKRLRLKINADNVLGNTFTTNILGKIA